MVIGDNGHSTKGSKRREVDIDLKKILKTYHIAKIERPIMKKDQLLFSVNQRMAYIYLLDKKISFDSIVTPLKDDARIDVIAWKTNDGVTVTSGAKQGKL